VPAKHRRTQIRNLTIAFVVPLLLALLASNWQTQVLAQTTNQITLTSGTPTIAPGNSAILTFSLTNGSLGTGAFTISANIPAGWQFTPPSPFSVTQGSSATFNAVISVPAGQAPGTYVITILATNASGQITNFFNVVVSSTTGQATLTPTTQSISGTSGQTGVPVTLTLTNNSNAERRFVLSSSNRPSGINVRFLTNPITVGANSTAQVLLLIDFGSGVVVGQNIGTVQITATTNDTGPSLTANAFITLSTTAGATATPVGCPDSPDPGGKREDASRILVNAAERHGICGIGDEDWFKFGAVGGKVYTIDITAMDAGIDLSLELYDEDDNLLTSNDDFFLRNPAAPDPKDLRPRIQSWRAPRDGTYYIRVRDNLNIGGNNTTYTIVVLGESYGPTPVTIPEICRDIFEEDGLPEQAHLITSNETQRGRLICPTGDADWVKFFGLRGKTYYLYTDTRPYKNNPDINNQTEAGADTVMYLADRDGVSIIDFNDDLGRDGESQSLNDQSAPSLDSAIRLVPPADGFYYAQIKNVGDIGNQFIRYDLTLKLCLPGQECRRDQVVLPAPVVPTPFGQGVGVTPTPTATTTPSFLGTPTPTATSTTGGFTINTLKPGPLVNGPLRGFADPAFDRVWKRNDLPIAAQYANRSWTWGPHGLMARTEGYMQSASGLRQVQYFDKARMEVNNPRGDRNSRWFVTTGLLVVELISGRVQLGDSQYVQHAPANIPIAGDSNDSNAPTYASFGGVSGLQPGDRTGQSSGETINRAGAVGAYGGPQRSETRLAHFVAESGHNIPQVFWDYLNSTGTIYENQRYTSGPLVDWVFTLGYPISEPYWTGIRVGGVDRDVLVQVFQRRVLTYSPDNPGGWQVEMGNVGRHYYLWRYGEELPPSQ